MTDPSGGLADAAGAEPRLEVGLATDVGQVRTGNEDSILCEPLESRLVAERGLFCAVADGMGGHAAGEDASSMAVQVARDVFYGSTEAADPLDVLRFAVAKANAAVYDAGAGTIGRDHMGTTLTAAVLINYRVFVGHVGDSRCYLVQGGVISQLSKDHSWVAEEVEAGRMTPEQARVNPRRNIITRALGLRPDIEVDVYEAALAPGSSVVICSDGLHGLVNEEEILSYVQRLRPVDAVDALVQLANERGGPDNISVVIARVVGTETDEADTARAIPVLNEAYIPTSRADLSDPADIDDMQTAPGTPVPDFTRLPDDVTPAAPLQRAPEEAIPGPPEPPEPEPIHEHDPPTPRTPVPGQVLATAATPSPQRRGGRGGGVALIAVILLLVVLGVGIGYLLFQMAGMTP